MKVVASYRKHIAQFLDRHADTPQVQAAVSLCADWLKADGYALPGTAVAEQAQRFKLEGITPRELLDQVGAIFAMAYHQPRDFPTSKRLLFAIGYALLRICKLPQKEYWNNRGKQATRPRVLGAVVRREIGGHFHKALSTFFANVLDVLEREHRRTVDRNVTLAKPFDTLSS
jgi:hypothetical protein